MGGAVSYVTKEILQHYTLPESANHTDCKEGFLLWRVLVSHWIDYRRNSVYELANPAGGEDLSVSRPGWREQPVQWSTSPATMTPYFYYLSLVLKRAALPYDKHAVTLKCSHFSLASFFLFDLALSSFLPLPGLMLRLRHIQSNGGSLLSSGLHFAFGAEQECDTLGAAQECDDRNFSADGP